ncbi:MAG: hypothetical protein ABW133_23965, partial [Polyangiaceae bacterium]
AMSLAKPGGHVVGTVPALMSLWSSIDEQAGHKIRYSEETLAATLAGVRGARVLEIAPFFRSLVPLVWVQRRMLGKSGRTDPREHVQASVQNLRVPPLPINAGLLALANAEHALARAMPRLSIPGASLWFSLARA